MLASIGSFFFGGAPQQARKAPQQQQKPTPSEDLRNICLEYLYDEIRQHTNNFNESNRLGQGNYGSVYRGDMPDGSVTAIKEINLAAMEDGHEEDAGFEKEIRILSKFRHPNLVTLLGWGKYEQRRFLIYECLSGGDVWQRLQQCREGRPFVWEQRLSMALDAATGLAHMHNAKPRAFHRDIKSANILIDGRSGVAKMADFGFSCVAQNRRKAMTLGDISGTPGYCCPNYVATGRITEGSEVFSYGMVLFEAICNIPASVADPARNNMIVYPVNEVVVPHAQGAQDRCVQQGDRLANWPLPVLIELARLAICAVDIDEERRPRFNEICRALRSVSERFPRSEPAPIVTQQIVVQHQPPQHLQHRLSGDNVMRPGPGPVHPGQVLMTGELVGPSPSPHGPAPVLGTGLGLPMPQLAGPGGMIGPPQQMGQLPTGQLIGPPGGPSVGPGGMMFSHPSAGPPIHLAGPPMQFGAPPMPPGPPPGMAMLGVEVLLMLIHLGGANISLMPHDMRVLPVISNEIGPQGVRSTLISRQQQPQWFETVCKMIEAATRQTIFLSAFEIAWGPGIGSAFLVDRCSATHGSSIQVDGVEVASNVEEGELDGGFVVQQGSHIAICQSISADSPEGVQAIEDRAVPVMVFQMMLPMFFLEVSYVAGVAPEALAALPPSSRSVSLFVFIGGAQLLVGREHPPGWFDALMSNSDDSSLLGQISRCHFSLELVPPGNVQSPDGSSTISPQVRVTCFSGNAIVVEEQLVRKGEAVHVSDGHTISFVSRIAEDAAPSVFLTFNVRIASEDVLERIRGSSKTTPNFESSAFETQPIGFDEGSALKQKAIDVKVETNTNSWPEGLDRLPPMPEEESCVPVNSMRIGAAMSRFRQPSADSVPGKAFKAEDPTPELWEEAMGPRASPYHSPSKEASKDLFAARQKGSEKSNVEHQDGDDKLSSKPASESTTQPPSGSGSIVPNEVSHGDSPPPGSDTICEGIVHL